MREVYNQSSQEVEYIISAEEKEFFGVAVRHMVHNLPSSLGDGVDEYL